MATHIALLRAINVGGRNKLPMAQLRQICAGLGWRDVATYIQSGNLVFSAEATADLSALGRSLSTAIRDQAGLDVPVVVRTRDNLVQIARDNPYPDAEPKRLSAVFLGGVPKDPSKLDLNRSPPDQLTLVADVLYWHAPNGVGRSKITTKYLERVLGVAATGRNWNTVNKLLAMTA